MVFHLGALRRLNDAGLPRGLARVSGGSIPAALLGVKWKALGFDDKGVARAFEGEVVAPIRTPAGRTIDAGAVLGGLFTWGTINQKVADVYDAHLYRGATLEDLPSDGEGPRFVINATNVQTGALWRFMKPYMRDYLVGEVRDPAVPLATAVGASSAFPPVLSPSDLEVDASACTPGSLGPLGREPYTTQVVLSDGRVYDNLGLETAWKKYRTVLVSDAGGKMAPEEEPHGDWARHVELIRVVLPMSSWWSRQVVRTNLVRLLADPVEGRQIRDDANLIMALNDPSTAPLGTPSPYYKRIDKEQKAGIRGVKRYLGERKPDVTISGDVLWMMRAVGTIAAATRPCLVRSPGAPDTPRPKGKKSGKAADGPAVQPD